MSARPATRSTACTTIASTAAFTPEEDGGDQGDMRRQRIEDGERQHDQRARHHEQETADQAAERPVHPPADPGRELLRLGTGQQMAEIERAQEAALVDPLALVDQLAVHERDLPGRPAEAQAADAREHADEFGQGYGRRSDCGHEGAPLPARHGLHRTLPHRLGGSA